MPSCACRALGSPVLEAERREPNMKNAKGLLIVLAAVTTTAYSQVDPGVRPGGKELTYE